MEIHVNVYYVKMQGKWSRFCGVTIFIFIVFVYQTLIAQLFQLGIVGFVICLVVFSCAQEADVLLQVMVNLLQSIGLVNDRKEPPRPG